MECNWGVGGKKRPVYYPHPSSADHAIQGFPRSDLMDTHVHEAIQLEKLKIRQEIISLHRENEKEQIRQEILVAETARRRELVVEVMREMAVEKEMAKGVWTDHQLTYSPPPFENHWSHQQSTYSPSSYGNHWSHQQSTYSPSSYGNQWFHQQPSYSSSYGNPWFHQQVTMAKQTRTIVHSNISPTFALPAGSKVKPNKDKLIVLDKPSQDRFGAQSTAVAPPATGSGKLIFIGKKPKEEWSCALCRVSASNERSFNVHLQGRKHKAKEVALRAETHVRKAGGSKLKKKTSFKLVDLIAVKKANGVGQTSKSTSESSDGSETDATASAVTLLLSDDSLGFETEDATAKKDTTVERASGDHPEMDETAVDDTMAKETKGEAKLGLMLEDKKKVELCCDNCDVKTSSKDVMEAHLQGKRHKARLQKQTNYSEVVPTSTISLSDTLKESGLQNAALEEAKMENPTADIVTEVDLTAREAIWQNPKVEVEILENPLVEEATRDDSMVENVRAEDPVADEQREGCNVIDEVEEIKAKAEELISERKKKFDFWCDICVIGTHSEEVMEAHLQGRRHKARVQKQSQNPEVATLSSSDTLKESELQNAALEEVKMENSTTENSIKLDLTFQEAKEENPMVELEIVENLLVEEATWDDSMVEKRRAEDPTVDEPRGEDPTATISSSDTFKESILQNVALDEAKMENLTKENSIKTDLTTQEAKGGNQVVVEEATEDDSQVEKVRPKAPAADEPIENRDVANEVEEGMTTNAEEIISERKKKFDFWCDICTIGTFSEVVMEAHLQGKKHRTKFQKWCAAI